MRTVGHDLYFYLLRLRLHWDFGTVLFEPFRVGTDRLPVYMMSRNRSVQNVNNMVENIMVEHCPY